MKNKSTGLMTIDEVRSLIIKKLQIKQLSRPSIYNWIQNRNFPSSIGIGIPRKWRRIEVETWLEEHIKGATK